MKKLIVALAAVAMTAGFAAMAQDADKQCKQPQQCTQQCTQPCDTACTPACPPAKFCHFDNLNLTDAQKAQFKALREKHQQQRAATKADRKAEKKADRKAMKQARLEEVKSILTPEQYVLFLENTYIYGDNAGKAAPRAGQKMQKGQPRGERHAAPMVRDARPQKAQKQ